jgi:hypothetical protein
MQKQKKIQSFQFLCDIIYYVSNLMHYLEYRMIYSLPLKNHCFLVIL